MSLKSEAIPAVPEDTTRVARAAFPHGNPYLTLRDTLGLIFADTDFAALFPACGQPGLPPWRLALVTIPALVTTSWVFVIFGDEGAELRFSSVFSPEMSEDCSVPSARIA